MQIKEKVGEIETSSTNKIIIHITEFQSKNKIDIRIWFLNEPTNEWLPTKKGITLELKHRDNLVRLLNLIDVSVIPTKKE